MYTGEQNFTGEYPLFDEDIIATLIRMLPGGGGILANTVFGRPNPSYAYDTLASSRQDIIKQTMRSIGLEMTSEPERRRVNSLSAYTGLGGFGKAAANILLYPAFRDFGQSAIGHYGGDQAVKNLLEFSNSMAIARGDQIGGLENQRQLYQNIKAASIEGGLVYNSFFNEDGSINVEQTKGVSLPTAGYIAGRVLSDTNIRNRWAQSVLGKPNGDSTYEGGITKKDIDNLKEGKAWSTEALKSFGDYVKKFTGELNGFVASVSKITGSYDEAITFLQRMTGGDLFRDTERAKKSREKASSIATNLRLAAANAGILPQELYSMTDYYSTAAGHSLGMSTSDIARGGADGLLQLGSLSASAYARLRARNPNASQEMLARMKLAIGDSMNDYIGSEQDKMNALAARLKARGVDMTEYESFLDEGNALKAKEFLINKYGHLNYMDYMQKDGLIWLDKQEYSNEYNDYATRSLAVGREKDVMRTGKDRMFRQTLDDFAAGLSRGDAGMYTNYSKDLLDKYKENLLSDDVLKAAGIEGEEQRKAIRAWGEKKSAAEINQYIDKIYGSGKGDEARRAAMQKTGDYAKEYGRSKIMTRDEEASIIENIKNASADALGISEEQRAEFVKNAPGKTIDQLENLLRSYVIDPDKARKTIRQFTGGKISSENSGMLDRLKENIEQVAPTITDEDRQNARKRIVLKKETERLNKLAASALTGDEESYRELTSFSEGGMLDKATGGDYYSLAGEPYIRNLIVGAYGLDDVLKNVTLTEEEQEKVLKGNEKKTDSEKSKLLNSALQAKRENIVNAAMKAHSSAVAKGKNAEETQSEIEDVLLRNGIDVRGSGDFSEQSKKKAMEKTMADSAIEGVVAKVQTDFSSTDVRKEERMLTSDEVRQLSDRLVKDGKTSETDILSEIQKAYETHYAEAVKNGTLTQEEADKLIASAKNTISTSGVKTIRRANIDTVNRALYVTEDGAAANSTAASAISDQEANENAVEFKYSQDKKTAAVVAANSANPYVLPNVIGQYSKEINSDQEAWRAAAAALNDPYFAQKLKEGDALAVAESNKQYAENIKSVGDDVIKSGAANTLLNVDEKLKNKYGKDYSRILELKDGKISKELQKELDSDEELKKLVDSEGFSEGGVALALKAVADERAKGETDNKRLQDVAAGTLIADKAVQENAIRNGESGDMVGTIISVVNKLLDKITSLIDKLSSNNALLSTKDDVNSNSGPDTAAPVPVDEMGPRISKIPDWTSFITDGKKDASSSRSDARGQQTESYSHNEDSQEQRQFRTELLGYVKNIYLEGKNASV